MNNERIFHPAATNTEVLLPGSGTLCIDSGGRAWRPFLREGLLRRVGPAELLITWTTGGVTEPADGNVTRIARSTDNGRTWEDAGLFRHPTRGLFTTELFCPNDGAEVHAFINTYPFGSWMTQLLSYRAISRDGGRTWDGPHSIPGGIQNVWPNRGIKLSTGAWLIPMSWAELIGEEWAEPAHGRAPVPGCCRAGAGIAAFRVCPASAVELWQTKHHHAPRRGTFARHCHSSRAALTSDRK